MKYRYIYLIAMIILLALGNGCDNRNPQAVGFQVELFAESDTLQIGDEINYIELTAKVMNDAGEGIGGVSVSFSANFGSVLGNAITNEFGYAYSTYWYEGTATGTAEIRARYESAEAMTTIHIVDDNPYVLEVWALQDTFVLGTGNQSTEIWASLSDRDGNALFDRTIMFSSESGYVTPQANTNENGYASGIFIHNSTGAETIQIEAVYLTATAITQVYVIEPEIVNISVWAERDTIYAGTNENTSIIYARLTDQFDEPLVEKRIDFSATAGSILPWDNTNEEGIAQQEFYYLDRVEYSTITASYNGMMDYLTITIMPFSYEISSVTADTLTIEADNDTLTFATISVLVTGSLGVPVSGKVVEFSPGLGYMSNQTVITDEDGIAVSRLHDTGQTGNSYVDIYCDPDQSFIMISIVPD